MRSRLHADLERWELGQLSLAELEARHPDRGVREIASLHGSLTSLRTEPTPPPGKVHSFPTQSPSRGSRRKGPVGRFQRPMIVAAALTVLTAGLALGLEPVRRGAAKLLRDAARSVAQSGLQGVLALVPRPSNPPVAGTIRIAGEEDQPVGWRPSVRDADDEPVSCLIVDRPTHGRASVSSNCSTGSYVPDSDFSGTDTFRYLVHGEGGLSVAAPVNVTVLPVNDPPVALHDTATTDEDVPVIIRALTNDADPDGDSRLPARGDLHHALGQGDLVVRSVVGGLGTVDSSGGRLTYTPASNFFGIDVFRYTVWDGNDGFDTTSVRVSVAPVNDPPITRDIVVTGEEDVSITWRPPVDDVDGDALSCSIAEPPQHGKATMNPDCSQGTFSPDPDHHGQETVPFAITDGELSVEGTVTFDVEPVNDPPQAEDVSILSKEDGPILWTPAVDDVDGDALACSILDPPIHGDASMNPDCSSGTYVPDPNFHGDDQFSYTVGDGVAEDGTRAKVAVSILPVNDLPAAVTDAATTGQDVAVVIPVLANDVDADGQPLTLVAVDSPASGVATANADGTVTYTPGPGFVGVDGFTYTVSDPEGGTATGNVIVTVIPSPIPVAGTASEPSERPGGYRPLSRSPSGGGLRSNPSA